MAGTSWTRSSPSNLSAPTDASPLRVVVRRSAADDRTAREAHPLARPIRALALGSGACPAFGSLEPMAASDIDDYLAALDETNRSTLQQLRRYIRDALPDVEECISYGMPAFKVDGKTVAGFAAFKNHLSYLPHSGSVFPRLHDELEGYTTSSGALRFGIGEPLPVPLVEKLIAVRLQQAFPA